MPAIEPQIGPLVHLLLEIAAKTEDHFVFLQNDLLKIDADIFRMDAPAAGIAGVIRHLCSGHHGLGRRASRIDTSASKIGFFDQGHLPAEIGETIDERIACLARADNDGVVFHTRIPF